MYHGNHDTTNIKYQHQLDKLNYLQHVIKRDCSDFTKSLCQIYIHKLHYRTNTYQMKSLPFTMSAVGTGPSPTWQSNITHVKQTIIIYKHNTAKVVIMYISLVIYVWDYYNY